MNFAFYVREEDRDYVGKLKELLSPHTYSLIYDLPQTNAAALLENKNILTSNPDFIKQMLSKRKCNLEDYYGSFWVRKNIRGENTQTLCMPPLKQLFTTKPGTFLFRRYLTKMTRPEDWFRPSLFTWTLADDDLSIAAVLDAVTSAFAVAVDIETNPAYRDPENEADPRHIILCVAYSCITFGSDGNSFNVNTFVIPVQSLNHVKWIRRINATATPKIFQNGKYDNYYFFRYGAPSLNWLFDTMEAHHAYVAELPKNLGYISAFYLREVAFWKDEGKTGQLHDLYQYNAKDGWATANTFLSWITEAPPWAIKNYIIKWGWIYPCFACELDGILVDQERLGAAKIEQAQIQDTKLTQLRRQIGYPTFNPTSPKQTLSVLKILGNRTFKSSDDKHLEAAGDKHPFARRIVDGIKDYRESRKLSTTYLNAELWKGKLLYTLNPSGTDSLRLASRESQLWCGTQLQNLPPYYKRTLRAEDGYYLGEGDGRQAEARCVAYLSGDENLITAVESPGDFHAKNAANFFGLTIAQIEEEEARSNVAPYRFFTVRDLSKRTNHGANYNIGAAVLLSTMGLKKVLQAKALLGLPKHFKPKDVTQHLLDTFSATYPKIKGDWYESIKAEIAATHMLLSQLGWTRFCFGNPSRHKPDLNSYVAHVPSNLSVHIVNEAFEEIYWKIQVPSNGAFRLKGQIHDSIPFIYKIGRLDLVEHAWHIMQRPKQIRDCSGKTRTMLIPIDMKGEGVYWTELKKLKFNTSTTTK